MQYQVPQFIDVEDKIFGPLTLKQFIYLAGAGGIVAILWAILPNFFLVVLFGMPFVALGVALAFLKINNRPFPDILESMFYYALSERLYLWKKGPRTPQPKEEETSAATLNVPSLSRSKLKDLAWNLDVRESVYGDTRSDKPNHVNSAE